MLRATPLTGSAPPVNIHAAELLEYLRVVVPVHGVFVQPAVAAGALHRHQGGSAVSAFSAPDYPGTLVPTDYALGDPAIVAAGTIVQRLCVNAAR